MARHGDFLTGYFCNVANGYAERPVDPNELMGWELLNKIGHCLATKEFPVRQHEPQIIAISFDVQQVIGPHFFVFITRLYKDEIWRIGHVSGMHVEGFGTGFQEAGQRKGLEQVVGGVEVEALHGKIGISRCKNYQRDFG